MKFEALNTYDWDEAFKYAHNPTCSQFATPCSAASFTREDVAELYGISEGENDGASWVCYGRLNDGRYFSLRASCDYTGWG